MLKKLNISLNFITLVVPNPLSTIIIDMRNFVTKFRKILEFCKKFAGNHVNKKGNVPRQKGHLSKIQYVFLIVFLFTHS